MLYAGVGDWLFAKCRKYSSIHCNYCVHKRFKLLIVVDVITEVFTTQMKAAVSFKISVTIF
jgi:hypothetical protein